MFTLQDAQSIHDSLSRPKINVLLIFTFYYKYLFIYKLGNETAFYLKCSKCINGFDGVLHGKAEQPVRLGCGSLLITTLSLLTNRSVLHEQVSLAAVNQICVIHETINCCKKKILRFIKGLLQKCKY